MNYNKATVMQDPVFDRNRLKEYVVYGGIAGILYIISVWWFLARATYESAGILYIGSILFMFVILIYHLRLIRRQTYVQSAWRMAVAGHIAVLIGVTIAAVLAFILCLVYIPGFMSGDSKDSFLKDTPFGLEKNNVGAVQIIFLTATVANFGIGSFISLLCSYVIKPNQTSDETPDVLQDTETKVPSSNIVNHPRITQ